MSSRFAGNGGCRQGSPRRAGFTLIEILVVVAIIALLISILLPSLRNAREQAIVVVCKTHLMQLASGHNYYAHDNRNTFPHWSWWLYDGVGHSEPKVNFNDPASVYRPTGGVRAPDSNSSRWVEYGDIYRYVKDKEAYFCPRDDRRRGSKSLGGGAANQGQQAIHSYVRLCEVHFYYQEKIDGSGNSWSDGMKPGDFIKPDSLRPGCLKAAPFPRVSHFLSVPSKVLLLYEEYPGIGDVQGSGTVGLNDGHSSLESDRPLLSTRHLKRSSTVFWDGHTEMLEFDRWNRFPSDLYALHKSLGGGNPPKP